VPQNQAWVSSFISILIFSALPGVAAGEEFHVAPTGCADTNDGSLGSPFCTLARAVEAAGPGDEILLRGGTYHIDGTFVIEGKSGSIAEPIVIRAYPGESPHFRNANDDFLPWTVFMLLRDAHHWVVDGGIEDARDTSADQPGLTVSHVGHAFRLLGSSNIVIRNTRIQDTTNQMISLQELQVSGEPDAPTHDVTIENNILQRAGFLVHADGDHQNGEGIYLGKHGGGDFVFNVVIQRNRFDSFDADCIDAKHDVHHLTIQDNVFSSCMMDTLCSSADGWAECYGFAAVDIKPTLTGPDPENIICNNVFMTIPSASQRAAINLESNATVYNNLVYDLAVSDGIRIDGDNPFTPKVYSNTVDLPADRAIVNAAGGDVKNNIGPEAPYNLSASSVTFVDDAAGDYRLASGSAGIDEGFALGAPFDVDIRGVPRPQGDGWDLGAYEHAPDPDPLAPAPPANLQVR
jgi:hypothetical protein